MSGYEEPSWEDTWADVRDDDVYADETWAEEREHAELEVADRLIRHGEPIVEDAA